MKFHLAIHGRVVGPYSSKEITGSFGGISPETLVCTEEEFAVGIINWRKAALFPQLAACLRAEISKPLSKNAGDPPEGLRLNILSTDDDSNIRELLWHMLTDSGHTVEFARDGEEVFRRLAVKNYDLVILDVNMPKMNGYKVSELLHDKLPNPPRVIIFTGRDLEKERLQFVCSGADAILNKGTGNDQLIQTIEELFPGKSEQPAAEAPVFVPEPQPEALERASRCIEPEKLQKEGFYASESPESPAPPAPAVPERLPEALSPPEAAADKAAGEAPSVRSPAPAAEDNSRQELFFSQLLLENKALKADLMDIRRLLGHIELEYAQLEIQFEKQTLKLLAESREVARELRSGWKNLRNYITLILSILLVISLAAVFLR